MSLRWVRWEKTINHRVLHLHAFMLAAAQFPSSKASRPSLNATSSSELALLMTSETEVKVCFSQRLGASASNPPWLMPNFQKPTVWWWQEALRRAPTQPYMATSLYRICRTPLLDLRSFALQYHATSDWDQLEKPEQSGCWSAESALQGKWFVCKTVASHSVGALKTF